MEGQSDSKLYKNRILHASRMQDMQHKMKKFCCLLNDTVSRVDSMSNGSLFHAFGVAATANALSEDTSLDHGMTSSCLSAERSDARSEL